MKAFVSGSLFCALALGMTFAGSLNAQTPAADTARYGPYPTLYKEIIMEWLNKQLIDPDSARIEWSEEPKQSEMGKGSEAVSGYLVNFTVNARNRFGSYTGKQKHSVLIRNGEVIKSMGFGY
ncbi:MAG TPA: hypothetical protein VL136_06020 [Candidatus Babeliales bacterium]|jgi:hypothetical protein|nr:hypothetical protein [Candidatus Babeliales bacterium]